MFVKSYVLCVQNKLLAEQTKGNKFHVGFCASNYIYKHKKPKSLEQIHLASEHEINLLYFTVGIFFRALRYRNILAFVCIGLVGGY